MNGSLKNWLIHAALALIIMLVFGLIFGSAVAGAVIATAIFWAREAGEKSKQLDGRPEGWRAVVSDLNPFGPRWKKDDRLDLAFPVAAVWLVLALLPASAHAASYQAATSVEVKALLPKLADGDVVELGDAPMGVVRWGGLKAVTIKGGVFDQITLDKPAGPIFDGLRVKMPATAATPAYQRAVQLYGGHATIRNFEISATAYDPAQPRKGVGLMFDGRAGANGQITVENGVLHNLDQGLGWLEQPMGVTVRNVTVRDLSTDGIQFGGADNVLIENFTCGARVATYAGAHPDCIQIASTGGPVNNLTIRNVAIDGWMSTQGVFLVNNPTARGRNWTISGVRMLGYFYRGLTVMNADDVKISDVVLTTPINAVHFSMLTLDNVDGAEIRDTIACSHARNNVTRLVESGRVTIPCRKPAAYVGVGGGGNGAALPDTSALDATIAVLKAEVDRQGQVIAAVRAAVQ
ncbi:hypothetical protein BSL82_02265 [Tardibacter chloracetimidivorans]|uniref:Uncharacterized protein n=1 Tax=Tardibacter chloracetimidivorans TaxID=1921510 RepID=A0A1L3ZRL4_9SPHN|nr:right-handed parallel beta-helix repeat-containing protein [Tardibacter chloracetimidivorans]API58272.1 hypothetical protein BSL82_02265 [Tardibacter chloracetimidivorans]